ncbi:MAG: glycosyltransferase family 2 protein [Acidimicrobiia bacterium]
MADPVVTVVVVNYRSGRHLQHCLDALLGQDQGASTEVIVVDNASGDESFEAARVAAAAGQVVSIESDRNLGLAGGVNLALTHARGRYLAVLNPDVVTSAGWLRPLVAVMQADSDIGVACPLILVTGTERINSAGQHIHVTGLGFNRFLGATAAVAGDALQAVPGLHGACFLIETELLRAIGGWDETGFLYQEDVALSWTVRSAGRSIVCVPASRVSHDYSLTMYPEKLYLLERNRWMLLATHFRFGTRVWTSPVILLSELLVWGMCVLRGPRFVAAKWNAARWVLAHRPEVAAWRTRVDRIRVVGDLALIRAMRWTYPLGQLFTLGGERGVSMRQPPGGLPTERPL